MKWRYNKREQWKEMEKAKEGRRWWWGLREREGNKKQTESLLDHEEQGRTH